MIQETGNTTVLCNSEAKIEVKQDSCEVGSDAVCENDNKLLLPPLSNSAPSRARLWSERLRGTKPGPDPGLAASYDIQRITGGHITSDF